MEKVGVVAFAFGTPYTTVANRRIAAIASKKARELNCQVYTQFDVRVEKDIEVKYTEEEFGNPPPTLRIARGAVNWAIQNGINQLMIVAAKPLIWRATRDIQEAIFEAEAEVKIEIGSEVCQEIYLYNVGSWFCPESTQDRVRSRRKWNKRERILRILPFFIYKRVAS